MGKELNVARYLLERGADVMIPDERGKTPLHTDIPESIALLREFGYQPMSYDNKVAQP